MDPIEFNKERIKEELEVLESEFILIAVYRLIQKLKEDNNGL